MASQLSRLLRSGRKAVCVGKNYDAHITELSHLSPNFDRARDNNVPMIFLKPTTAYALDGSPVRIPRGREEVHFEVELGVVMGSTIDPLASEAMTSDEEVMRCVAGYCVAIDMTDREIQSVAKKKGAPWSVAKGFDTFLPLSEPFLRNPDEEPDAWRNFELWLSVNGEEKQRCKAGCMIHQIPDILRYIGSVMTLEPGDLVITGTPSGVGPVRHGDVMTAGIEGIAEMKVSVVSMDMRSEQSSATSTNESNEL